MKNFKNCILGINIEEKCFTYLKSELESNFSFDLVEDLFSLPCIRYETQHKLSLVFALLEDKKANDTIVNWLSQLLADIPKQLWIDCNQRLKSYIEINYNLLSRSQLLLLANTLEVMNAKGYDSAFELAGLLYQRIPFNEYEFNPDSEENLRIKLSKLAYNTSGYNIIENLEAIKSIKQRLKLTKRKYLYPMLYYYKGICLEAANYKIEYKDSIYYILKAQNMQYKLASLYLKHRA